MEGAIAMFRGFNLSLDPGHFSKFYEHGIKTYDNNKYKVTSSLESFYNSGGDLSASKIIENWFPSIKSHVFISHSHLDSYDAVCLSGWLNKEFGLDSFIDSCVWGYSDNLLKKLDDKYCYQKKSKTYNYNKRNKSTSHVHIMLSVSLSNMINNCECSIFLNTPNSISFDSSVNQLTTESPWIFSEIAMTHLIEKRTPDRHKKIIKSATMDEAVIERLSINYEISLDHLIDLTADDLEEWKRQCRILEGDACLDKLYELAIKETPNYGTR